MEDSEDTDKRSDFSYKKILRRVRGFREEIGLSLELSEGEGILRRYFVMNAFDGAMTSLGVIFGALATNIIDPMIIVGVIFSTSLAMAISGISGAYFAERAEREHELNDLENAMLTDLENTIHGKATRWISILAAFVDGFAPFLASMICIIPFLFVLSGMLSIWQAFFSSIVLILTTLFALGIFLGRLSDSGNIIFSGLKMVIAGMIVAFLSLLLRALPG